ncbi:type IV secretion system protein [Acidovorax sp. LjRoot118]
MNPLGRRKNADLASLPQSQNMATDPRDEFAEIYGSALVGQQRWFIVCLILGLITLVAIFAYWQASRDKVAIPWLVEVNPTTGAIARPVKIEAVTPNQAVVKAELAKWVEQAFTIDPKQSMQFLREATSRTNGKAVDQFRAFRVEHDIVNKINKEPNYLRFAKVATIDLSQRSLAFVYVKTHEISLDGKEVNPKSFRVRVDYALTPPKTEEEIFANPLGFVVTQFSYTAERQ